MTTSLRPRIAEQRVRGYLVEAQHELAALVSQEGPISLERLEVLSDGLVNAVRWLRWAKR